MASYDILAKQRHSDYKKNLSDFQFYRAAINARLDGGNPRAVEWDGGQYQCANRDVSWLIPHPWEDTESYKRRLQKCTDSGFPQMILFTIIGYMLEAFKKIDVTGTDEEVEKVNENIDGNHVSFRLFYNMWLEELLGMGAAIIATDNPEETTADTLSTSYIIPRENFLDWALKDGELIYAKWSVSGGIVFNEEKYTYKNIEAQILYSKTKILKIQKVRGRWEKVFENDNKSKIVPVVITEAGREAIPIIESAAKYDVKIMNVDSGLDEILGKQAIAIPYFPLSTFDKMQKNKDGSIKFSASIISFVGENEQPPGIAGFPSSTLDAHFKQIERLEKTAYDASHIKGNPQNSKEQEISGESKRWDWKNKTAPLLEAVKMVTISTIKRLFEIRSKMSDKPVTAEIIWTSFNISSLEEELRNIMATLAINVGTTGNSDLRKTAYRLKYPEATEEKLKIVDAEIDADEIKKAVQSEFVPEEPEIT